MELGKVYTDGVIIGERQRHLDEKKVAALAESMAAIGLQQPISIWADGDAANLVAGAHRLAAAIKLGWDEIDCIFVGLNEIDRQIWEIDENLYRNELTTEEMRDHLRRRKELWEQRKAEDRPAGKALPTRTDKGKFQTNPQEKGFAAETAEATGLSKRRINQLLADPKPKPEAVPIDRSKPNMEAVADRLATAYDNGCLQELIDHLTDIIKRRMAA